MRGEFGRAMADTAECERCAGQTAYLRGCIAFIWAAAMAPGRYAGIKNAPVKESPARFYKVC